MRQAIQQEAGLMRGLIAQYLASEDRGGSSSILRTLQETFNSDGQKLENAVVEVFEKAFRGAPREHQLVLARRLFRLVGTLWVLEI